MPAAIAAAAALLYSFGAGAGSPASASPSGAAARPVSMAVDSASIRARGTSPAVATGAPSKVRSNSAAPATAATPSAGTVGLWAADWGGAAGSRSSAGWQFAAQHEQIMIGIPAVYKKWVAQLHAWNPSLLVLGYNLGPYLQKGSANYTMAISQHPDWFAHDARGNLINLPAFPNNYLMEMSSAGFRAWHAQQLAATVAADGLDGAMDDSMGSGPLGGYGSANPVNPATGQPYTPAQYLQNAVLMLNADKAALNGKYLAFNGLISGRQYVSATHILATSNADAGVSELFLRQPNSSASSFPSATDFADSLQMMSDMAAHGKAFLGWTKVWSGASSAQVAQWQQFALGAYLLGQQSQAYIDFMPSRNADNTAAPSQYLQTNMGAAAGSCTTSGSSWSRAFANGSVTVSLSSDTATIS